MAAIEPEGLENMEQRLAEWAAWLRGGAQGGAGYPRTNILHQSWLPPSPEQAPTMATGGMSTRRERQVHQCVLRLSVRLQNTLAVVFVMRAPTVEQVRLLQCEASTVRARVSEAKKLLASMLLHGASKGVLPVIETT